jgi:hypothetical protein
MASMAPPTTTIVRWALPAGKLVRDCEQESANRADIEQLLRHQRFPPEACGINHEAAGSELVRDAHTADRAPKRLVAGEIEEPVEVLDVDLVDHVLDPASCSLLDVEEQPAAGVEDAPDPEDGDPVLVDLAVHLQFMGTGQHVGHGLSATSVTRGTSSSTARRCARRAASYRLRGPRSAGRR